MTSLSVRMAAILRLLDQTGMREAEAVGLERGDVDGKRETILLRRTKTGRPRALSWRTPGGDAGPILAMAPGHGPLFPAATGDPYANFASNFGRVIGQVAAAERRAGRAFRRFRVHDLRHGFGIRRLKRGGDLYQLSRHLGHASIKTTEIYLAYLTVEEASRVGAQMGAHEAEKQGRKGTQ